MSTEDEKRPLEKPMSDEDRKVFRVEAEHIAACAAMTGTTSGLTKATIGGLELIVDMFHDQAWRDGRRAGMAHALRHAYPDMGPVPDEALRVELTDENGMRVSGVAAVAGVPDTFGMMFSQEAIDSLRKQLADRWDDALDSASVGETEAARKDAIDNALNKAYSDGYKTGHMHGSNAGRWLDGMAVSGPEPIEEPAAEASFVHVTVSRKGRITASGPAPDVLAVLRGVLELEEEGSSLWGMPIVKSDEVPEGVIVVKVDETGSQAIREAFRAAERRNRAEPESDTDAANDEIG